MRWQRALARLRAAEAEVRAVELATAGGTAEEEEALEPVYMARLGEHKAALLRLMKVRAPDLPALALKIELAIDEEIGTLTGGERCLAVLKRGRSAADEVRTGQGRARQSRAVNGTP